MWFLPAILLLVVAAVMLGVFMGYSKSMTSQAVDDGVQKTVSANAEKMQDKINQMVYVGRAITGLTGQLTELTDEQMEKTAVALKRSAGVYAAICMNGDGIGVRSDGAAVDLSMHPEIQDVIATGEEKIFFEPREDVTGRNVIAVVIPEVGESGNVEQMMMMMQSGNDWLSYARDESLQASDMIVATKEGTIIASTNEGLLEKTNCWAEIAKKCGQKTNDVVWKVTRKQSFVAHAGDGGGYALQPLSTKDWYLVEKIDPAYFFKAQERVGKGTQTLLTGLAGVMALFMILVCSFLVVSKLMDAKHSAGLEEKAETDQLTGLLNKISTERQIREYMERNPNSPGVMFLLDIDDFKSLNDTLGHAFGDEVLKEFSFRLSSLFRASDIIGRIGGDEFMVYLKEVEDEDSIQQTVEKLRQFVQSFHAGSEYIMHVVTASAGFARFPKDGTDFVSMYKSADQALYYSKRNGKSRVSEYH